MHVKRNTQKVFCNQKVQWSQALSTLFPLVFELDDDEKSKRKFWKEFIIFRKENRFMNRTAHDLDYAE